MNDLAIIAATAWAQAVAPMAAKYGQDPGEFGRNVARVYRACLETQHCDRATPTAMFFPGELPSASDVAKAIKEMEP